MTEVISGYFSTDVGADRNQSREETTKKLMFKCHECLLPQVIGLIWMMLIITDNSFPIGNVENLAVM